MSGSGSEPVLGVFWPVVLVLARLVPIALITPLLGGARLAAAVRISLIAALALAALASALAGASEGGAPVISGALAAVPWPISVRVLAVEVARGAVIGLAIALVFAGIRAGLELSFALVLGPWRPARTTPTALASFLGVAIFFAIDGHHGVIQALAASYRDWPIGQWTGPVGIDAGGSLLAVRARVLAYLPGESARALSVAVAVAAPLLCTSVFTSVAIGLWQRVHASLPTQGLFEVGGALVGAVTLVVAVFATGAFIVHALSGLPDSALRLIE